MPWTPPAAAPLPQLVLYNTLTRSKVPFVPITPGRVTWYLCGPTVYDAAHMGHARNYVAIDINRRVMQHYFNYDVVFVQNITDIEDKIIIRARHNLLFDAWTNEKSPAQQVAEVAPAIAAYIEKNLPKVSGTDVDAWAASVDLAEEAKSEEKVPMHVRNAQAAQAAVAAAGAALANSQPLPDSFHANVKDIMSPALDKLHGASVNDPSVFRALPAFWERLFQQDMRRVGVADPDITTRVTEYVPEIVAFVERIIANGYAYAAPDGLVYFDTHAFDAAPNHDYAKLVPSNKNNLKLLAEGEGALSSETGKRLAADFALWKASKPGEPLWPLPWAPGRPGWHIECLVMALDVLGMLIDIHTGGIDLAFPHHDNELAQLEAHFDCAQWVNYFLHSGHLHIEGQKMLKLLKNFISIDEALRQYSLRQLRLVFALLQYNQPLDFKALLIDEARNLEGTFSKFFTRVRALFNQHEAEVDSGAIISIKMGPAERRLEEALTAAKEAVHAAWCDNLNTPLVLRTVADMVSKTNTYVSGDEVRIGLVVRTAKWATEILAIIGFPARPDQLGWEDAAGAQASAEEAVLPIAQAVLTARDQLRALAQASGNTDLLVLADEIRTSLLLHRVSLDDQASGPALVKYLSVQEAEELQRQQAEKEQRAAEKAAKKAAQQAEAAKKAEEQAARAKIRPQDLFKDERFSAWDENGIPTLDAEGVEVSKSARKKLQKQWDAQKKIYKE